MLAEATTTERCRQFERLVMPYQKFLLARASNLAGTAQDALDLRQDTLERALRNFHRFQAGTNVKAWLLRIMHNIFVDTYRRRTNEPWYSGLDISALPSPDLDAPRAWEDFEVPDVLQVIDRLEAPFRVVFDLHFTKRRSNRDIARELGIPPATVGTRLLRARQKIKSLLPSSHPPD
jgi:RNA polymerase sigma-70 factor (ECF subfamily)